MDCSFSTTAAINFADIFQCTIANMGLPFDFIVIGIFAAFVLFAAMARLDFDFSLGIAIAISWALMVISGNASVLIQYILGLLILGLGLRILMAIIKIFRQ